MSTAKRNSEGAPAIAPAIAPNWHASSEVTWWGTVLLCATEGSLFAYFLAGYLYLGTSNRVWPPPGIDQPALVLPLCMTAVLVSSSVLLVWAERALGKGRRIAYLWRMAGTLSLGVLFLALQAVEYRDQLAKAGPTAHAYLSLFFTITGFHGLHVCFGILLLLWTLRAEQAGRVPADKPILARNTSLYWHFVDGVWLVVFTVLYLSPRLSL